MRHQASTKIITFFSHYHGILSITQMRLLLKHRLLIKRMLGGTQAGYKVSKLYIRIMVVYTSSGTYHIWAESIQKISPIRLSYSFYLWHSSLIILKCIILFDFNPLVNNNFISSGLCLFMRGSECEGMRLIIENLTYLRKRIVLTYVLI